MANIKAVKITLETDSGDIVLTIEQAKELHGLLGKMFDKEKEFVSQPYYPVVYPTPEPCWPTPIWYTTPTSTGITISSNGDM